MPTIENPRELLVHMLGEALYFEQRQAEEVLPQLAKEVKNEELRSGLEQHAEQTKQQASSLEKAFGMLGVEPNTMPNYAFDGLRRSHDETAEMIQSEPLKDALNLAAAVKAEHLEVAGYRTLITMAEQLGESELTGVLRDVCEQEEQMAQRLEQLGQQLAKQLASS